MTVRLAPVPVLQFFATNGDFLVAGTIDFYAAGSTTRQNTYTDSTGLVANANPIVLNARGEPPAGVHLTEGLLYKMVVKDSGGSVIWTADNIAGINDTAALAADQWIAAGFTPTYINPTSFSLPGDQTSAFHIDRRLKTLLVSGTGYHTITSSSFGIGITTVNVNGTPLDFGLSAVSYSVLSASNDAFPRTVFRWPVSLRTENQELSAADSHTTIIATGSWTQTFAAESALGNGWTILYRNDGAGMITLDPVGTIDNISPVYLWAGESCIIVSNGTNLKTIGRHDQESASKAWCRVTQTAGNYLLGIDMNVAGIVKNAVGQLRVTFSIPFASAAHMVPTPSVNEPGSVIISATPVSGTECDIDIRVSTTGANIDANFSLVVHGLR